MVVAIVPNDYKTPIAQYGIAQLYRNAEDQG